MVEKKEKVCVFLGGDNTMQIVVITEKDEDLFHRHFGQFSNSKIPIKRIPEHLVSQDFKIINRNGKSSMVGNVVYQDIAGNHPSKIEFNAEFLEKHKILQAKVKELENRNIELERRLHRQDGGTMFAKHAEEKQKESKRIHEAGKQHEGFSSFGNYGYSGLGFKPKSDGEND